ncbi:16S rRNA (guanine(527)-N(7))-methyltransferase RsmG [Agarilytica rhodophyticola]|uniref:16S rRNA (guanine(527)-N(7))-methyltransferase RsmG n=1 Tax=Agarilytica rhodophyticola TaxID=1737490 RepID=UPI001FE4C875|nr:16S rRNA (guanine(527)-N(7))-methyltransferase RsmG [Agarilytica rhodophyticola]
MNYPLESSKISLLLDYLELLIKWNSAYNLSAIRDPEQMLYKHLLDSLSVAPFVEGSLAKHFIDVGTGAGLPGIPLAICYEDKQFTLLDSAGKKTRFLQQVVHTLGLKNVKVVNTRVESYVPEQGYDVVISRAFASLTDMIQWCKHLLTPDGQFWAMKGVFPQDELSDVEKHYMVESCSKLQVPGDVGERCLLIIKPKVC